ncbi:MAG TPA: S41 family peptidase [Chloroflexota bacterium]|nr:S41 family peptidase [Chloroflexota bacterium]
MNRPLDPAQSRLARIARLFVVGPLILLMIASAAVPAIASGGSTLSQGVANQADAEPGLELIAAVYNSLQDRYFRPLDSTELLEAAWEGSRRALSGQRRLPSGVDEPELSGDRAADLEAFKTQYRALLAAAGPAIDANSVAMAASEVMTQSVGEQHTYFLQPEQFSRYVSMLTTAEGRVGLGIVIQGTSAPFRIAMVVPGAPAEQAGVQEGDQIEAIDGREVRALQLRDVSEMLRGAEGQPVTLRLRRGDATVELTAVRARYKDAPLTMRVLPEGVCHFKLTNFPVSFAIGPSGRNIGGDFDHFLEQCEQAGGKAWIVDLRGNPGGNAIGEVLGRFMDAGPIMVERDRLGGRYEQATDGHLFRVQRPLVVLIDRESASASEIFASAVQEHGRGVVLGQRSAGALNTTIIVRLPLGAGMGVAIREVFTGRKEVVVDEVGVAPDVTISLGRDPTVVPPEAIQAALDPAPGVGPLPPGPSTFEGMLPAAELRTRATPLLLDPGDVARPEDRVLRGELALDTIHYYTSDSPSLPAARERALRLGWQGVYLRWIGGTFPSPFSAAVSFYRDADGAHQDLREIYQPGEPQNPRQWRDVESPVMLGDDTVAQVGTGQNEGRVWISWRRGGTVYTVAQTFLPGQPQPLDELARLAQVMDERAHAAAP